MDHTTIKTISVPNITLKSMQEATERLKMQFPDASRIAGAKVAPSPFMPPGYFAVVGRNSLVIGTPSGKVLVLERRDAFSEWKPKA